MKAFILMFRFNSFNSPSLTEIQSVLMTFIILGTITSEYWKRFHKGSQILDQVEETYQSHTPQLICRNVNGDKKFDDIATIRMKAFFPDVLFQFFKGFLNANLSIFSFFDKNWECVHFLTTLNIGENLKVMVYQQWVWPKNQFPNVLLQFF